jgi:uncharacterized membrane protein YhaH (DUF805 family)
MDWTWYLFRFDGRINRAKLWLAMPVILGGLAVLGAVIVAIQSLFGGRHRSVWAPRISSSWWIPTSTGR